MLATLAELAVAFVAGERCRNESIAPTPKAAFHSEVLKCKLYRLNATFKM